MNSIHALAAALILSVTCTTWAEEEPVKRSSHPQGYVSADQPPAAAARTAEASVGANTTLNTGTGTNQALPSANTLQNRQTTAGGVNLTGNTRIDAKAQATNATAIGQENTSGNRVGSIGGK